MSDSLRGRWIPLLVCCVSGGLAELHADPAQAAENLSPLRVDPALLRSGAAGPPPAAPKARMSPPVPAEAAPAGATAFPLAPPNPEADPTADSLAPVPRERPDAAKASPADAGGARENAASAGGLKLPASAAPLAPTSRVTRDEPRRVAPQVSPTVPEPPAKPAAPAAAVLPTAPAPQEPAPASASAAVVTPTPPPAKPKPLPAPKPAVQSVPTPLSDENAPTLIAADHIRGVTDLQTDAEGRAELVRPRTSIAADRLTYLHPDDEVVATGNVRVTRDQDVVTGPRLQLRVEENIGHMDTPAYTITRPPKAGTLREATTGSGEADLIKFQGENHYRLENATYSTCGPSNPDWYARMNELTLDYDSEVGVARNATLVFKGVPMLYTPWLEFSLNNQRKSGFLAPTIGGSSRTGTEIAVPYYWNIAPNRDATITPRLMGRRGLLLGSEFRYLEPTYFGTAQAEYLPKDNVTGQSRNHYAIVHNHVFANGFAGNLNLNGVSDPLYFTDLSSHIATTSQQLLLRQGQLTYGAGWWSASLLAQSFQVLNHPLLPFVGAPYERLPQVAVSANRPDLNGFAMTFTGEFVDFKHPTATVGQRLTLYPQLSYPLQSSAFFLTPKVGAHMSHYSLDRQAAGTPSTLSRGVPIASLDAGAVLERDTDWLGKGYLQTLEPRLFYVYVPFRDQSQFPVFDSGATDFNFAQLFTETHFAGNDRVGDANQLTAAVTSRLIDPDSGEELMRGTVGQRYYFSKQRVTFPGVAARANNSSDILASLSGRVLPKLLIDTTLQYNPNDSQLRRIVVGGRYNPAPMRVLNASYRFQRDVLREVDVSAQWPVWGNWYGVGRYNYSLRDKRLVEALGGFEYDGGCWILRGVFQRFATATQTTNTAFFVQLEFNGFSRIGSNPLDVLKRSIPGYGKMHDPVADPVFGE